MSVHSDASSAQCDAQSAHPMPRRHSLIRHVHMMMGGTIDDESNIYLYITNVISGIPLCDTTDYSCNPLCHSIYYNCNPLCHTKEYKI